MQASQKTNKEWLTVGLYIFCIWIFFGLIQTAHFHLYFSQPILLSLKWGLRDWLIWVLLICGSYRLFARHLDLKQLPHVAYFALLAVLTGAAQLLLIVIVDFFTDGISRPFFADFWHLYRKRWFQNLLIFLVLWFLVQKTISMTVTKDQREDVEPTAPADNSTGKIKITDGKQHIWLDPKDISQVEVTGNYLCFFTDNGQHVTRGTMKELTAQLADHGFIQVNRSCLVNVLFVKSCERVSPSQVKIHLQNGEAVFASRRYWKTVKHQLGV